MAFNGAQFHLLVNHIPVVGFPFLIVLLLIASETKIIEIKKFTLIVAVAIGMSSLAAFWTGEPAEDVIEDWPGVSAQLIHGHEELAEKSMVVAVLTALAAAGAYLLQRRRPESINKGLGVVLIFALITTVLLILTAHEGGKIRHPEIMNTDSSNIKSH